MTSTCVDWLIDWLNPVILYPISITAVIIRIQVLVPLQHGSWPMDSYDFLCIGSYHILVNHYLHNCWLCTLITQSYICWECILCDGWNWSSMESWFGVGDVIRASPFTMPRTRSWTNPCTDPCRAQLARHQNPNPTPPNTYGNQLHDTAAKGLILIFKSQSGFPCSC